ncbi:MAG: FkbM family methyltransferase [Chitinophagaceae bacterium]
MHNGLYINLGSYYGPEVAQILFYNKGVHEPQEEYVFSLVLKDMPQGATMIEMGSFWAFYSMWFQKAIPNAKNFMIEPESFNITSGKKNFNLNRLKGDFVQAFISSKSGKLQGIDVICVDDFVVDKKIEFIHLLHSDIQGYEYEMLQGAKKTIDSNKIGYIFLSTHTNDLHYKCLEFLKLKGFHIVASADLNQTYSDDGLIVAKSNNIKGIDAVEISLKKS